MNRALKYAFKHSLPILISFIPVGLAYGILMRSSGYSTWLTGICCLSVLAGSLQFLMIDFFSGATPLVSVAVISFLLNSRHIFYGLPFLEKWKNYGWSKLFLIYALTDEAFSLHCSNEFEDVSEKDKKLTYVFSALFVLIYWFSISIIGALVGSLLTFNTAGIDFALTGLFIVILIDMILSSETCIPAVIAAVSSLICLYIFKPNSFILPSLLLTVASLFVFRKKIEGDEK